MVRDKADEAVATQISRYLLNTATGKLLGPRKWLPCNKLRPFLAQVTKDTHSIFSGVVAGPDESVVEDLDELIDLGFGRLGWIEPIDEWPFNLWRKSGLRIDFRRVLEKNESWVADLIKEPVVGEEKSQLPRNC